MLNRLYIRDLALLKEIEVNLQFGLSVLTGETGAGKSMIMDALALCLGERANLDLIRSGAEQAWVEATFSIPTENLPLSRVLDTHGLDLDDEELIVRRVLNRKGKSRAFVNGCQITQSQLQEIGERLGDIHGQHDHQLLLRPHRHAEILDRFGDLKMERRAVRSSYQAWQDVHTRLRDLHARVEDQAREEALLRSYVEELEQLGITADEEKGLQQERARLRRGEQVGQAVAQLKEVLGHMDGTAHAVNVLHKVGEEGAADLAVLAVRLDEWQVETTDLHRDLASMHDIALDPDRLNQIETRLQILQDAARKHRVSVAELPKKLIELQEQLTSLGFLQEGEEVLEQKEQASWQSFTSACETLSKGRHKHAASLIKAVSMQLEALKLADMQFDVALIDLPQSEWSASGAEQVSFLVAPNKGSDFHPLSKVASGGEVSRLMLALKTVFYAALPSMTLVFDEIDTGTGGAVADAVGDALYALGARHQVLAITHQPQVAAKGNAHIKIDKLTDGETTRTIVTQLDDFQRQEELARMLSGKDITKEARAAAVSLLKGAA